jgi:hypothetical protein
MFIANINYFSIGAAHNCGFGTNYVKNVAAGAPLPALNAHTWKTVMLEHLFLKKTPFFSENKT